MRPMSELVKDFHAARKTFEKLSSETPRIMGNIGIKVMKENFTKQGFDAGGFTEQWKERSPVTNKIYDEGRGKGGKSNYKGSVYNSKNPILIQTGNLKSGLSYRTGIKSVNIGVNLNLVPYAKLMNEGGAALFNGKWVYIPKRRFLGWTSKLSLAIKKELILRRGQTFKVFRK
jgi:phage gpG-like protein